MVNLLHPHRLTMLDPTAFGFMETDEILMPTNSVRPIPEEYTVMSNYKKMQQCQVCVSPEGTALHLFLQVPKSAGHRRNCTMQQSLWLKIQTFFRTVKECSKLLNCYMYVKNR